jgi:hypothetical protein
VVKPNERDPVRSSESHYSPRRVTKNGCVNFTQP